MPPLASHAASSCGPRPVKACRPAAAAIEPAMQRLPLAGVYSPPGHNGRGWRGCCAVKTASWGEGSRLRGRAGGTVDSAAAAPGWKGRLATAHVRQVACGACPPAAGRCGRRSREAKLAGAPVMAQVGQGVGDLASDRRLQHTEPRWAGLHALAAAAAARRQQPQRAPVALLLSCWSCRAHPQSIPDMSAALAPPRAAWPSGPACALPARCLARRAARLHCLAASSDCRSDVLLIDAQNVLSRAGAAAAGRRRPGEGVAGSFADWLRFLAAAAQPQLMVAVFDAPTVKRSPQQQREQLAEGYLQRRKRRRQQSAGGGASPAATSSTAAAARPAAGDPLRPFKREVEQLGGICLEAAAGWEADDGLAAAAAAISQRHPAARTVVASGDGDMQQLLATQVSSW